MHMLASFGYIETMMCGGLASGLLNTFAEEICSRNEIFQVLQAFRPQTDVAENWLQLKGGERVWLYLGCYIDCIIVIS